MAIDKLKAGTRNLLQEAMGLQPGERVLLVLEPDSERLYDKELGDHLASEIREAGAELITETAELVRDSSQFPARIIKAMQETDHSLFLSRIGDYSRFCALPGSGACTICYATSLATLASDYAATSHRLLSTLYRKLEAELQTARHWQITCPLGTRVEGEFCWPSNTGGIDDDFSLSLFPVSTFKPVPCASANGRVALTRWLTPGGAPKLERATIEFNQVVFADVEDGMLIRLSGPEPSRSKVVDHYEHIASTLKINRNRVHSWHAGINPFTRFSDSVDENLESWGAVSFASPRYLHFHTCGDSPPGEIAWSVFNPTVLIDDIPFWEEGQLVWLQRADNAMEIRNTPGAQGLLGASADIGV